MWKLLSKWNDSSKINTKHFATNSFLGKDANDKGRLICLAVDIVLYRIGFTEDCSIKGVFERMKFVQKSTAAVRRTISAFFLCLITE